MPNSTPLNSSQPSKNALSHGAYSHDVVLAWENPQEFDALHQALREEYCPQGASEEAAVFDLANLHWKKRRLNIGSQLAFHRQRDADAMANASTEGWKGVANFLKTGDGEHMADDVRAVAKSQAKAAQLVCNKICQHVQRIIQRDETSVQNNQSEDAEFEKLTLLAKELNIISKDLVVPLLSAIENHNLDQKVAERAYRPDVMEKELKIHAEIDRQIEKAMKRLVAAKEFKNFYRAKPVEPKQIEATNVPAKPPNEYVGS